MKQIEAKIGAYALIILAIALGIFVGVEGFLFILVIGALSVLSYYLYVMPTRNSSLLKLIKVFANVFLNIFLFPLLVMSWTVRPYKKFIEEYEKRSSASRNPERR